MKSKYINRNINFTDNQCQSNLGKTVVSLAPSPLRTYSVSYLNVGTHLKKVSLSSSTYLVWLIAECLAQTRRVTLLSMVDSA